MKKKKYKKNDIVLDILIGLTIVGVVYLIAIGVMLNLTAPVNKERPREITFEVQELNKSYSLRQLGADLEDNNIIRDKNLFWVKSQLAGQYYHYIPGTYIFSQSMSTDDVINLLINGE